MTTMPAQRVTPPLSGVYIMCALLFIGFCSVVGGVFAGSTWAGAGVGLVLVLALVVAYRRAGRRNTRRRRA